MKTHTGVTQNYLSSPTNKNVEHKRQRIPTENFSNQAILNSYQMRESLKPSTNFTSPNSKVEVNLNSRKTKLSLSGTFKSQINAELL